MCIRDRLIITLHLVRLRRRKVVNVPPERTVCVVHHCLSAVEFIWFPLRSDFDIAVELLLEFFLVRLCLLDFILRLVLLLCAQSIIF